MPTPKKKIRNRFCVRCEKYFKTQYPKSKICPNCSGSPRTMMKNWKRNYKKRIENGLCYVCSNKAVPGKKHCQKHLDIMRERRKKVKETWMDMYTLKYLQIKQIRVVRHRKISIQSQGDPIERFLTQPPGANNGKNKKSQM